MGARPLSEIVEAGWAEALAPVAGADRRDGRVPARRDRRGPQLPAGRARTCCARSRSRFADVRVLIVGQDPYPTPGHPIGLSLRGRAATCGRCRAAWQNIYRELRHDLGLPDAGARRPDAVDRAGRAAAQQGADRRAGRARRAPRQGLGGGHRAGDPGAGRPRQAAGRRSCGGATRRRCGRCSATCRRSSRRIRARCRPTAASSAPGRSAGPTSCSSSRAPTRRLAARVATRPR